MPVREKKYLDSKGRLYFTGLKEGDIAETVLMPGDLARSKIIAGCFKEAHFVNGQRTYYTYTGVTQNDTPISVVSSGMGPLAVSTVAEECSQIGMKNLIRVGTGAALLTDYQPGRIIIATGCVRGDGNSYEYVPAEYPAIADPYVTKALIMASKEFGEDPIVGLYRAHDSYYRETSTAMIDTYERMKPWVDAGVKMVENESATLFTVGPQLGLRCGSICVSHTSMVEDTVYYTGPKSEEAYPEAFEDDFMDKRILVCSKIAVRATEILAEMEKKGVIR
ncbi:MAG: hypothetical protein J5365_04300 [Erysipelotrichaceae bacterium]|nr:hypothetical protein [Erysipelotrichaceae bacterium]